MDAKTIPQANTKADSPPAWRLIETAAELARHLAGFANEPAIAIDLEADSMFHYHERVCLLQLASPSQCLVIDPLKVKDLSLLHPLFADGRIQKVLHGADYDVRSLHRDFGIRIHNLFDTQIACRFLGYHGTGLEAVLQARFGICLNKKYQKKDWSRRPLPDTMVAYAVQDVLYLLSLADTLTAELKRLGRMAWVREECNLLTQVRFEAADQTPLFLKFKGAGRLRARGLAVLEALLQFRDQAARQQDRPHYRIIGNEAMMKLALARPATLPRLEKLKILSPKQLRRYGGEVVRVVQQALALPDEQLPVYPRKKQRRPSPAVPQRVKALKTWRDRRAGQLGLDPSLLLNKALLNSLAIQNPRSVDQLAGVADLKSWQRASFGDEILAALQKVRVAEGK